MSKKYGIFKSSFTLSTVDKNMNTIMLKENQTLTIFYTIFITTIFFVFIRILFNTFYSNKHKFDELCIDNIIYYFFHFVFGLLALLLIHSLFGNIFKNNIPWHLFIVMIIYNIYLFHDIIYQLYPKQNVKELNIINENVTIDDIILEKSENENINYNDMNYHINNDINYTDMRNESS